MTYAPIHNHTEYSALDGLSTVKEVGERCKEIGCPCCGITDHGTVAGHLEFGKEMKKLGIKPIYGCELYHGVRTKFAKNQRDQAHFVAGAMSDQGLRNLWSLVNEAATNYRYVGRVNWDMLAKFSEGVFATSACISGLVAQGVLGRDEWDAYDPLNRYLEIFRDNFYIEIHTYPGEEHERLNVELVRIAQERGIPLIYATDAHFAFPDQYETHDTYVAMSTGDTIYTPVENRKMWHPKALYMLDEQEIRNALCYLPDSAVDEALENSGVLAEKCNAELPEIKRHLPAFIPRECPWTKDSQETAAQMFMRLVEAGLIERYGENAPAEVWDRAAQEIEVFLEAGLEHYFLQAWDFCEFCNREGIRRGPGRGSAAGAIVAYALGITDVDPLHYGLIFERFYNPGRAEGFPDIDNDFPVKHRKRVRQYLMDRWGEDKVKTIGTTTRMKPKSVLEKTYKACGATWNEMDDLKKIIGNVPDIDILGADSIGWAEESDPGKTIYVLEHVGAEIIAWLEEADEDRLEFLLHWLEVVEATCSRVSGYGVHPSGVVVSDVPLAAELPCMWNRKQEIPVTCFSMNDVDGRQFVKQDLLGLRNLDTLEEWEAQVGTHEWRGMDKLEYPDEMWEMLDQGLTLGIFQIEKGYARKLCKEFKPRSVEDLGIIVALNRPGPIRSGAPDSFITRRFGGEDDKFDGRKIPLLAEIVEPTYGWFLYQEQVIAYFNTLGYDLSESDAVRKILGKKKPEQMRALYRGEGEWEGRGYMTMAVAAGLDKELAQVIWSKLEDFAKYSFNKSHAIAYAIIAFRTLYAKWKAVAEFTMSCIRTNHDDAGDYVSEGRRMGVSVNPPDILNSLVEIGVVDGEIYFGFSNIKGIGVGAAKYLIDIREKGWPELGDDGLPIEASYEEGLIDYAQTLAQNGPEVLREALNCRNVEWEEQRDHATRTGAAFRKKSPKQQLQENKVELVWQAGGWDQYIPRDIRLSQQQKLEKELLQVILTDDCDEVFSVNGEMLDQCDSYADLEYGESAQVHIPGVVATLDPKKTKKDNKSMGIVTIEYQGDQCEFVVFPRQWSDYRFMWKERTPGVFTLKKTDRGVSFEKATKLTA